MFVYKDEYGAALLNSSGKTNKRNEEALDIGVSFDTANIVWRAGAFKSCFSGFFYDKK